MGWAEVAVAAMSGLCAGGSLVLTAWIKLRGDRSGQLVQTKKIEAEQAVQTKKIEAEVTIQPQLAFYEDLMARVRDLEQTHTALLGSRDDVKRELAEALAQNIVFEGRVEALVHELARAQKAIERIRSQRDHYRELALQGAHTVAAVGLSETSEHLAAEISDADEATSLQRRKRE